MMLFYDGNLLFYDGNHHVSTYMHVEKDVDADIAEDDGAGHRQLDHKELGPCTVTIRSQEEKKA